MMRWRTAGVLPALALSTPTPAHAHLVNSGLGPFYDGALHLILTPMDIIGLATLSLFAGLQGRESGRLLVVIAPLAWFVAGLLALSFEATGSFAVANAGILILLGGSIALGLSVSPLTIAAAAAALGGLLGFQSGLELWAAGTDWVALSGAAAVVFMVILSVTALVVSCTAFGFRVAFRVFGSWAAATGLLSIGWIVASGRS